MIGRGGMGAVWKGVQRSLDRIVAIKILPSGIEGGDVRYSERFKMEAKSMARLSHPGIVAVFDAGESADGLLYFVMEFIEDTDVQKMIELGRLPPERAELEKVVPGFSPSGAANRTHSESAKRHGLKPRTTLLAAAVLVLATGAGHRRPRYRPPGGSAPASGENTRRHPTSLGRWPDLTAVRTQSEPCTSPGSRNG
jgi:hypothetical protein